MGGTPNLAIFSLSRHSSHEMIFLPLILLALGVMWWEIHQTRKEAFMRLSELSATLNTASDTLDAILLRLPAASDPELGPANEAAVTRLNASVQALNAAVPIITPV